MAGRARLGITLWELLTGLRPFAEVPISLLAHKVVTGGRPEFLRTAPPAYVALAECCWEHEPASRSVPPSSTHKYNCSQRHDNLVEIFLMKMQGLFDSIFFYLSLLSKAKF